MAKKRNGLEDLSKMPALDALKKIVEDKQCAYYGGMLVDMFSASAVLAVHGKLNDANKAKLEALDLPVMVHVAFELVH